jgi:hypothetical protein
MTSDGRPEFLDQLRTAVEELSRSRGLLGEVIQLADDAPDLADAELRTRLTALAYQIDPGKKTRGRA